MINLKKNNQITIVTDRVKNHLIIRNESTSIPTFFLHGFTGASGSWESIIQKLDYYTIAPDITGHGKSEFLNIESDYGILDWCDDFNHILESLELTKINVCGYSMGGRLAIAFAARYPHKIGKLILESVGLGINDYTTKNARFQDDLRLSDLIEKDLSGFNRRWEENPLFSEQKNRNKSEFLKQRELRLSHDPLQLSKSLKVFSQGVMDYYEADFSRFNFPIMIINGSEDSKYIKSGEFMSQINQQAVQYVIDKTGHNVHLESEDAFLGLLEQS